MFKQPFPHRASRAWRTAAAIIGLAALVVAGPASLRAGGPLNALDGQPGRWAGPAPYSLDLGGLGPFTNAQAVAMVRQAIQIWEQVPGSTASFHELPPLPIDLDAENILDYFQGNPLIEGAIRPENPIVFDEGGEAIDLLLGSGSSETILALAGPRSITRTNREFRSAFAIFNGRRADDPDYFTTVVHEMGHFLGLDHTQIHNELASNASDSDNHLIPIMYPLLVDRASQAPLFDDRAWISWLYPTSEFSASTGAISGSVFRADGSPLPGAHVVAVRLEGGTESVTEIVSAVSGFMQDGNSGFLLPGLAPGDYVVFIEPLDDRFVGSSRIGPFDERFTDFDKDYFNGLTEKSDADDPMERAVLRVQAGQTVARVEFHANEPADSNPANPSNQAPTVDAGEDRRVNAGDTVLLNAQAEDPERDPMTFEWTQIEGPLVGLVGADRQLAWFRAPSFGVDTVLIFRFSADDGEAESSDQVEITVAADLSNRPPTVSAGEDRSANRGEVVQLDGHAFDPDGDALVIDWVQISGPTVQLDDRGQLDTFFTAPGLLASQNVIFELRADDGRGGTDSDRVTIHVLANRPPSVEVESEATASLGRVVALKAAAQDPDGDSLSYSWTQTAGPPATLFSADQATMTFTVREDVRAAIYEFKVEVSDGIAAVDATAQVVIDEPLPILLPNSLGSGSPFFSDSFVAGAALNPGVEANRVYMRWLDDQGQAVGGDDVLADLEPKGQISFLADQLTGSSRTGALLLRGQDAPVQGFFLIGDVPSQRELDGVGGRLTEALRLFFPRVACCASRTTLIYLFNASATRNTNVRLTLRSDEGELLYQVEVPLAREGSLTATVDQLFQLESWPQGYLEAVSETPIRGFQVIAGGESYAAMTAGPPLQADILHAAHFFTDGAGSSTLLRLVNLDESAVRIRATAFSDSAEELGSQELLIEAGHATSLAIQEILEAAPNGGDLVSGYLQVRLSTGPLDGPPAPAKVIGGVEFLSGHGRSHASLPLLKTPLRQAVLAHIAQPSSGELFQGLAVVNSNQQPAQVRVFAYDAEGLQTGLAEVTVQAGARVVDLLNSPVLLGLEFGQIGGHLRVESDQPVFLFSLFGDRDRNYLAAIEAQPIDR